MATSPRTKQPADRWYDEMASNCEGCGWLRQGSHTNGLPYVSCYWYGTIMTRRTNAQCSSWTSPTNAAKELERQAKMEKERWELTAATRKRRSQQFYEKENED